MCNATPDCGFEVGLQAADELHQRPDSARGRADDYALHRFM
jgi:hypothetical protein